MLPRPVIVFTAVLCLVGMLQFAGIGRIPPGGWAAAVLLAGILAFLSRGTLRPPKGESTWLSRGEFLCDTCKYDHPNLCSRPDRPNATKCPDYKRRG